MSRKEAITAEWVFDGEALHDDAGIVFEGPRIIAVLRRSEIPRSLHTRSLPDGLWLAPGFVDVQVNGGGDVLFNDSPSVEGLTAIARAHRTFGTTAMLPTLITDTPEKTIAALAAVDNCIGPESAILGIHLEGPFLSPDRAGVHKKEFMRRPSGQDLSILTARRRGVVVVTLAPEQVHPGFISELIAADVRVSLGHSMATYEETRAAIAEGLTGFTHLFNAMPPLSARGPGPVAAALEARKVWYGLIVDGIHVHPAILKLTLGAAGRPMLVTDAMPPVGGASSTFELYGETVTVRDGRCLTEQGTLAGAFLDMASAVRNCVNLLGVTLERALQLASTEPAQFLGLGAKLGKLAAGYRADCIAIDPKTITVTETWIGGRKAYDE